MFLELTLLSFYCLMQVGRSYSGYQRTKWGHLKTFQAFDNKYLAFYQCSFTSLKAY
jgi:hypothetical protein